MIRRFIPAVTLALAVIFDTAILPVFYTGRYAIMLSLLIVIMIAVMLGRIRGMIYGTIAGMLMDIASGTLGMKLFGYLAIGFIIGFMLDRQPELYGPSVSVSRKEQVQYLLVRFIWISVLLLLYEITMLVLQYWSNAVFRWSYVRDILIRTIASGALILAVSPLFHFFYIGNGDSERAKGRKTREVKNY